MTLYVTPERDEALDRLLAATAGTGEPWSIEALRRAAGPDADLLFPGGMPDLIEAWADLADRRMIDAAEAATGSIASLTEKVRRTILLRLDASEPHRPQVRRALALLTLPRNAALAARVTARTADAIWRAAGDTSSGSSFYTKRVTVSAVYGTTLLYWVSGQHSRDEVEAFLDRRLAGLARFGRLSRRLIPARRT